MSSTLTGNEASVRSATFLLMLSFISTSYAGDYFYTTSYKGITPEKSSFEEMEKKWGKPKKVVTDKYGRKAYYEGITATFSGSSNIVNSIVLENRLYTDANGLSVGDNPNKIASLESCLVYTGGYILDTKTGIGYWHDGKKIQKITYSGSVVLDRKKLGSVGWQMLHDCSFIK